MVTVTSELFPKVAHTVYEVIADQSLQSKLQPAMLMSIRFLSELDRMLLP